MAGPEVAEAAVIGYARWLINGVICKCSKSQWDEVHLHSACKV
jgi:hypothetical protein